MSIGIPSNVANLLIPRPDLFDLHLLFRVSPSLMNDEPIAIVLAAGRGTRMKSDLPKVLCPVLGRAMINWVLDALNEAGFRRCIVVVGYKEELVRAELAGRSHVEFAVQSEQKGTGHAVQMCDDLLIDHDGPVLVVAGDSPLIQSDSIAQLLASFQSTHAACLLGTLIKDDPHGLGRIVRDREGKFVGIVEQADATAQQLEIREVNMSTYLFDCEALRWALSKLSNDNAQGELYLTDCPGLIKADGRYVDAKSVLKPCESISINTVEQLGLAEEKMRELGYPCKS